MPGPNSDSDSARDGLVAKESAGDNSAALTITEISQALKRTVEDRFGYVKLRGELSGVKRAASGHLCASLKDEKAVIDAVMWRGTTQRLSFVPEDGIEVVASGKVTTYPGRSKYQIVIEDIKPAGMGALMALLEKRKAALAAEGLFAPERKRPLPYLPEVIGVVTSPSGAVIRDILHRLRDRFPRKVLIWPVAVQGAKCAPEVARAIAGFNALTPGGALPRPDLLIVARGGGSVEDLWGFNEEIVARAAAASDIPLISAVGHETDTTLIDYVSDKRAPTPTAAAELAVPVRHELVALLDGQEARMTQALSQGLARRDQRLRDMARALPRPDSLLDGPRQRLDMRGARLGPALTAGVQKRKVHLSDISGALRPATLRRSLQAEQRRLAALADRFRPEALGREQKRRLEGLIARFRPDALEQDRKRKEEAFQSLARRLSDAGQRQTQGWHKQIAGLDRLHEMLSYKSTLARGYAVVRGDGGVVTTKQAAQDASALEIEFIDGKMKIGGGAAPKKTPKKAPEQGSLF